MFRFATKSFIVQLKACNKDRTMFQFFLVAIVPFIPNTKQQQLTFTDVRPNRRLTKNNIAVFSDISGQTPVPCLKHCLANNKKCKAININTKLKICELLGDFLHTNNESDLEIDKDWVYYGPKQKTEVFSIYIFLVLFPFFIRLLLIL